MELLKKVRKTSLPSELRRKKDVEKVRNSGMSPQKKLERLAKLSEAELSKASERGGSYTHLHNLNEINMTRAEILLEMD
jgi:hypothetical protein